MCILRLLVVDRKIIIIFQVNITPATTNCKEHGHSGSLIEDLRPSFDAIISGANVGWLSEEQREKFLQQYYNLLKDLQDDCNTIGVWNNIEMTKPNCPLSNDFGNGICDAVNNNEICGYDGGDCCGNYNYYGECYSFCNAPNAYQSFESEDQCLENCKCKEFYDDTNNFLAHCNPYHYGDGYCDDYLNTPECFFDGGDCCITIFNTITEVEVDKYCADCTCIDSPTTTTSTTTTSFYGYDTTNITTATTDHGNIYRGFMKLLDCPDFEACTFPCLNPKQLPMHLQREFNPWSNNGSMGNEQPEQGWERCNRFYSPMFVEQKVELVQSNVDNFKKRASLIGDRSSVNYVIGYNRNTPIGDIYETNWQPKPKVMVCMRGGWILMLRNVSNFWDFPVMLTRFR